MERLRLVLDHFSHQFELRIPMGGLLNEQVAVETLADSLREKLDLTHDDLAHQHMVGRKRLDLWVESLEAAFEVKFHRVPKSGYNAPMTVQFGQLMADLGKLRALPARERYELLIADRPGMTHIANKGILPIQKGTSKLVAAGTIDALPQSALRQLKSLEWVPLEVEVVYRRSTKDWSYLAWAVKDAELRTSTADS